MTSQPLPSLQDPASARRSIAGRILSVPGAAWRGIKTAGRGVKTAIAVTVREVIYWLRLFVYTSRRYLRVETYLALIGAICFFGYVVSNDMARTQRELLAYNYIYFTAATVWLASTLLPREREENTLEILWSQPMSRAGLITLQIVTLTVWMTALCALVVYGFSRFSSYQEGKWLIVLCVSTTSLVVAAATVLISTFTRHVIATALLALLVFGVHYYWLTSLGPIALYPFPIKAPDAPVVRWGGPRDPSLWVNRIAAMALAGFIFDYLYRRLRRTAEWFT
ncbi:MAG: ABC transporter permease subunit [bacterium]|nr:ABC transporter permease subunit [bacterium]